MHKHNNSFVDSASGGELLFRTLWKNTHDNMFIVRIEDDNTYIIEASNRAQEQTFGLKPNQLNGYKLKDIMDSKTFQSIEERYTQCVKSNQEITYEESALLDGENERFWTTTILPVTDTDGVVRIFGISREFTQLKNIEKKLEEQVHERTQELNAALKKMKILAETDKLTCIYNRVKLDEVLETSIQYTNRYQNSLGLLILDIDYFKVVNDKHGHLVGDSILKEFAQILKSSIRESDTLGRWGGEEFLIICPNIDEKGLHSLSKNLLQAISKFNFTEKIKLTASIGGSLFHKGNSLEKLISNADNALYKAKNSGRNRFNIFTKF